MSPHDSHRCGRCGAAADLGMTCVGWRCRRCGCDRARGGGDDLGYLSGEDLERGRRLWGWE